MRITRNNIIEGSQGRPIAYDYFLPENDNAPLVVFCHGFKGFKDWGPWNLMGEFIAQKGFAFVKFNLSHNGVPPSDTGRFADPEGFEANTTALELNDLQQLLNHLFQESTSFNSADVTLIGHSRGGPIVILHALNDPRITRIVTWNAVSDLHRWLEKYDKEDWESTGHVIIRNSRTGHELPMGFAYYSDLLKNAASRNVLAAASKLRIPYSIIHAAKDEAVPLASAIELKDACAHSDFHVIDNTGHTFGASHPWSTEGLPESLIQAILISLNA